MIYFLKFHPLQTTQNNNTHFPFCSKYHKAYEKVLKLYEYCLIDNSDYRVGIYYNEERERDVVPTAFYFSKQYFDSTGKYKLYDNVAKIRGNFVGASTGDVVLLEKKKSSTITAIN